MNSLEVIALPAIADNYIWVLRVGAAIAVVDPGDAMPVLDYLDASGVRLCAILATHHHGDHVAGIERIAALHAVPVYGPAREDIPGVTHPVAGGDHITLAELGIELDVLDVAGHTRGHVAYYRPGQLFCGDTLFGAGCGRIFEGTPAAMHAALAKLAALPPETQVYCAHEYTEANLRFAAAVEPDNTVVQARIAETRRIRAQGLPSLPSSLSMELATNPFLRWRAPAVIAAATARLGHAPSGDAEVFAAVREWRNGF